MRRLSSIPSPGLRGLCLPLSLVLLGATLSACGDLEGSGADWGGPTEATAGRGALWSNSTLWSGEQTIPVCWTVPGFQEEKAAIRASLRRSWQQEAAVAFHGFRDCPAGSSQPFVRVELTVATDPPGAGGGSSLVGRNALRTSGVSTGIAIPTFATRVNRLDYLAVHEFGHVLGFQHEQDRQDSGGACGGGSVSIGSFWTPYDPQSVMHYCGSHGNGIGTLSALDKQGVAAVYGPKRLDVQTPVFSGTGQVNLISLDGQPALDDDIITCSFESLSTAAVTELYGNAMNTELLAPDDYDAFCTIRRIVGGTPPLVSLDLSVTSQEVRVLSAGLIPVLLN